MSRVWRKKKEKELVELQGHDNYSKQAPLSRIIPLWGGLGPGGFAPVLWHPHRKTNAEEWSEAIKSGALLGAMRAVSPRTVEKPWKILCDNESFLRAKDVKAQYTKLRIKLLKLPARSPDLKKSKRYGVGSVVASGRLSLQT